MFYSLDVALTMISTFIYTVLANFITSDVYYYCGHLRTIDDHVFSTLIHVPWKGRAKEHLRRLNVA